MGCTSVDMAGKTSSFFFFFFGRGGGRVGGGGALAARGSGEQSLAWAGEGARRGAGL